MMNTDTVVYTEPTLLTILLLKILTGAPNLGQKNTQQIHDFTPVRVKFAKNYSSQLFEEITPVVFSTTTKKKLDKFFKTECHRQGRGG